MMTTEMIWMQGQALVPMRPVLCLQDLGRAQAPESAAGHALFSAPMTTKMMYVQRQAFVPKLLQQRSMRRLTE